MKFMGVLIISILIPIGLFGQFPDSTNSVGSYQPQYMFTGGIGYNYLGNQASAMTSLAVKAMSIAGKPTYSITTAETALVRSTTEGANNTATIRTGILQVLYNNPSGHAQLFILGDAGVMNGGTVTLGNFTGATGIAIDLGGIVTKDKYHVFLIPTVRMVNITATQTKVCYGLQFGTGF